MKILDKTQSWHLGMKRFPAPCFETPCPACGNSVKLKEHFSLYPIMNVPFNEGMYCPKCDHEWNIRCRIEMQIYFGEDADIPVKVEEESGAILKSRFPGIPEL